MASRHRDALWDQRARRDQRALADRGAVQNDGPHADQCIVLDDTAVQHGVVADAAFDCILAVECNPSYCA
jgi:hypothetical protein